VFGEGVCLRTRRIGGSGKGGFLIGAVSIRRGAKRKAFCFSKTAEKEKGIWIEVGIAYVKIFDFGGRPSSNGALGKKDLGQNIA